MIFGFVLASYLSKKSGRSGRVARRRAASRCELRGAQYTIGDRDIL